MGTSREGIVRGHERKFRRDRRAPPQVLRRGLLGPEALRPLPQRGLLQHGVPTGALEGRSQGRVRREARELRRVRRARRAQEALRFLSSGVPEAALKIFRLGRCVSAEYPRVAGPASADDPRPRRGGAATRRHGFVVTVTRRHEPAATEPAAATTRRFYCDDACQRRHWVKAHRGACERGFAPPPPKKKSPKAPEEEEDEEEPAQVALTAEASAAAAAGDFGRAEDCFRRALDAAR